MLGTLDKLLFKLELEKVDQNTRLIKSAKVEVVKPDFFKEVF